MPGKIQEPSPGASDHGERTGRPRQGQRADRRAWPDVASAQRLDADGVLGLQRAAGNRVVSELVAAVTSGSGGRAGPGTVSVSGTASASSVSASSTPTVQRTSYTDVVAALDDRGWIFHRDGDHQKAWGILNGLNMADMLATMEALNGSGNLARLLAHTGDAVSFNLPRLLVAAHAVQLKVRGVDVAGLGTLAGEIGAAGNQVEDVERYLGATPGTLAGPLSGLAPPGTAGSAAVNAALNPISVGSTGISLAWDGDGTTAAHASKRNQLKREVTAALKAHLRRAMPSIRRLVRAPKLPMTAFEGAGRQAKRFVDAMFGTFASGSALTSGQRSGRAAFNFTAGTNLLDETDPARYTPNPDDIATWIAETDGDAAVAQSRHHFDKGRSAAERNFLATEILAPFVAANRSDLAKYDAYGFATADPNRHTVWTVPALAGDTRPRPGGVPSPAERAARWAEWQTLVHEYIHTLEHPAFGEATRGRRVMTEGFCELFTKSVLTAAIPVAQADGDPTLRGGVEGTDSAGALFPGFAGVLVGNYDAGQYADYLAGAEAIQAATSPAVVRAAFFLGHVELIGLTPSGTMAAPTTGPTTAVTPPSGIASVFALATITGSTSSAILAANPGLTATDPLPGSVLVPGTSYHTVVEATETRPTGGVLDRAVETPEQIAAFYGVTGADVRRANPGVNWATVRAGARILVPVHA